MRDPRALAVLTLLLCSSLVNSQLSSVDEAIVRAMRGLGFQALYSEARAEGTLVGRPADDAGRLLFVSGTGLSEVERDALLLVLLIRSRDNAGTRVRLRTILFDRVGLVSDWSLIAELLSPSSIDSANASLLRGVHLELARRILLALESSQLGEVLGVAGYEPAAIALASSVGETAGRSAPASPASDLVLAETLREIGRLSRDTDVVAAVSRAARELLMQTPESR